MLIAKNIAYQHSNKEMLFDNISLTVNQQEKIALVGNNGTGKSTLLKIIAGELHASEGRLQTSSQPYYVPQVFGQFDHLTIAQVLKVESKINALNNILQGHTTEENYQLLEDDWTIEERCLQALRDWHLDDFDLSQHLSTLSGGQKTKVFLAGISIHQQQLVLMDEPSNHLDVSARKLLYEFVQLTKSSLIVVSHDRKLLNLLNTVCELGKHGLKIYGGNYDFYREQKQAEKLTLAQDIQSREKELRKAKEKERETLERQQRLDSRGKAKQEKAGVAKIMMNTLRNKAENSTSKLKSVHAEKIGGISQELQDLKSAVPGIDKMKFGLDDSMLHKGRILVIAQQVNHSYKTETLWNDHLDFEIRSGERIALKGSNGSGKTTLVKLIIGAIEPQVGKISRSAYKSVYIDQDYSLINNNLSVFEQLQQFNKSALAEHELKIMLTRFLFTKETWDKACKVLSGGERMRLALCCLAISSHSPDMIILDEPTNNLDIQNIEILTKAINAYEGTLVVISHDESFLEEVKIERIIAL